MKTAQLRTKSAQELSELAAAKRSELEVAKLKSATEEVKSVRIQRGLRKDIAQILTIRRQLDLNREEAT